MIDPIKKFVEQNREAFDHKEPPANALELIKIRMKAAAEAAAMEENATGDTEPVKEEEKKTLPLFSRTKWALAASVFLAVTAGYFLYQHKNEETGKLKTELPVSAKNTDRIRTEAAGETNTGTAENKVAEQEHRTAENRMAALKGRSNDARNGRKVKEKVPGNMQPVEKDADLAQLNNPQRDLYADLADSTSASIRLSAILEIGKTRRINITSLNSLAGILNHDPNSNVRLAALDVMGQYAQDRQVSSLLVQSLSTQTDPLVQLGLIGLLGKLQNVKIDDRLFALAEDPNTLGAVKDEAYAVLLNQNKL